ncbi:hypothetical protein SATRI_v1c11540 [Spiroplasma atrichopogonis]|nr:hypothetical protein [Spiroplasma mirum]AKM53501.1 hypothetical protein SATRI_v1c11540 [Spiroplasma atrichopogonis]
MKIYGELTSLKKLFETYNENPNKIDLSQIDLEFYYTKSETDELISLEKNKREKNSEELKKIILNKQLKLYDDVPIKYSVKKQKLFSMVQWLT